MLAAAIERGIVQLSELTLEEWQFAIAYMEGCEQRLEDKAGRPPHAKEGEIRGCLLTPEEVAQRRAM
jgi:hypothetical protein